MNFGMQIPEPLMFNPLKHYLPFIREYINIKTEEVKYPGSKIFIKELKPPGNTGDGYLHRGTRLQGRSLKKLSSFLELNKIPGREPYMKWVGTSYHNLR